jgi:prepilin-type N-terminal cleavage/methylation domain-containing protein
MNCAGRSGETFERGGPARRRPGFTLAEISVAVLVLAAALVAVAQTAIAVSRQQQSAERQAVALQAAANVMERLYALPWSRLLQAEADQISLSPTARQRLPEARLVVTVTPSGESPPARRIEIELDWRTAPDGRSQPVRLTAWKSAAQEGQP